MSTVIPIRSGEPTFADLCDDVRRAKAKHLVANARFKAAQDDHDAAWNELAKAQRALGEFCDRACQP